MEVPAVSLGSYFAVVTLWQWMRLIHPSTWHCLPTPADMLGTLALASRPSVKSRTDIRATLAVFLAFVQEGSLWEKGLERDVFRSPGRSEDPVMIPSLPLLLFTFASSCRKRC